MDVGFAGEGWGAVAALKSLQKVFGAIEVLTSDMEVGQLLRQDDIGVPCMEKIAASWVVCAGYKAILPPKALQERTFINVHYSLLPKYRGMHSTVWAIMNDEKNHGLTIHLMNEHIDDGPILAQYGFDIAGKTAFDVMTHCNAIVEDKLGSVVKGLIDGRIEPVPQDKSLATWVPRRNRQDCLVNVDSNCASLRNFFRALVRPYPLPMLKIGGELYEITAAKISERQYDCTHGRVVNIDEEGAWIKIADGLLIVQELEHANKKYLPQTLLKIGQRL